MTKIPSVEQPRCKKLVENGKAVCNCILNCHLHDWRQKDHTIALLTKLRDSELLEERKKYPPDAFLEHRNEFNSGHNTLAKAIKAHLDELIKSTSV